jgi:hypothetical protein
MLLISTYSLLAPELKARGDFTVIDNGLEISAKFKLIWVSAALLTSGDESLLVCFRLL